MGRQRRGSRKAASKPLQRRVGTRSQRRTLLVFTDGQKTETQYLNALKRLPEIAEVAAVDLHIVKGVAGFAPVTLVNEAVEAKRQESEVDEVWCVFDVEQPEVRPSIPQALDKARQNGVQVAMSNPCFELWLILHFEDCNRPLNTDDAQRKRKRLDGAPGKEITADLYMGTRHDAAARARALDKQHEQAGTRFPKNYPSSGMHRLLAAVQDL